MAAAAAAASRTASSSNCKLHLLLFVATLCCVNVLPSGAFDFEVGDETGWAVPPPKLTNFYNIWASNNRFKVGDTVNFKYGKDSMMVVSQEDYEKCLSSHPIFFSNDGRTEFKLNRPGMFYFISGVAGHCQKGQKMIIKVMGHPSADAPSETPSAPGNQMPNSNSTVPGDANGAGSAAGWVLGVLASVQLLVVVVLGSSLF